MDIVGFVELFPSNGEHGNCNVVDVFQCCSFSVQLVTLPMAHDSFESHDLSQYDKVIDVGEMVTCLTTLYEKVQPLVKEEPRRAEFKVNVQVDLLLNWLINVYDRSIFCPFAYVVEIDK